jgi:hypothetical protein
VSLGPIAKIDYPRATLTVVQRTDLDLQISGLSQCTKPEVSQAIRREVEKAKALATLAVFLVIEIPTVP